MLAAAIEIYSIDFAQLYSVLSGYLAVGYKKALVKKPSEMCKLLLAKRFADAESSRNFVTCPEIEVC
jgi:hypothetical protein